MADRREVHPQLVGAPGQQQGFDQRLIAEALAHPEARLGAATPGPDGHPLPIAGSRAMGGRSGPPLPRCCRAPATGSAFRSSDSASAAAGRLRRQRAPHHEQPGGVLVEPMDDARPQVALVVAQLGNRASRPLTSVPRSLPGAGCTTMPAGLSTTIIAGSSSTQPRTTRLPQAADPVDAVTPRHTWSPSATRWLGLVGKPLRRTASTPISRCHSAASGLARRRSGQKAVESIASRKRRHHDQPPIGRKSRTMGRSGVRRLISAGGILGWR